MTLAEDGLEALERVQDTAPDVMVTDLRMPGLDGIELLRRARETAPELVVVLVTAFADIQTAVRAMQEGADHCERCETRATPRRANRVRATRRHSVMARSSCVRCRSFTDVVAADGRDS